jgi:hypothetical protein
LHHLELHHLELHHLELHHLELIIKRNKKEDRITFKGKIRIN